MKSFVPTKNLRTGFGKIGESKQQYIANFFKQHNFNPLMIDRQQKDWIRDYTLTDHEYSLEDLLQCEHHDLSITDNPNNIRVYTSHPYVKTILYGRNGFWSLHVTRDYQADRYDFSISVSSGGMKRFHPVLIKNDICTKYGSAIYEVWKSMVLEDIACLERLVELVQDEISFVAPSITCCQSSARLCQRVGIPVRNEIAFLFSSRYV